jgi:hypothetical protein
MAEGLSYYQACIQAVRDWQTQEDLANEKASFL